MNAIKFDKDKVKKCIEVYHDMHDKYPYMMCNEKTMGIIPEEDKPSLFSIANSICDRGTITYESPTIKDIESISINSDKYVKEKSINTNCKSWYGAKIMIDNDLKFGEVELR